MRCECCGKAHAFDCGKERASETAAPSTLSTVEKQDETSDCEVQKVSRALSTTNRHTHLTLPKMMRPEGNELDAGGDNPAQAFLAQTSRAQQQVQAFLDRTTPYTARRWGATAGLLTLFMLRILLAQGWYIGEWPAP